MNIKTEISKLHYDKNPSGLFFLILKFCSLFYDTGSKLKNFLYDKKILKSKKVDAFTISVGNFTTGGVGKTPIVAEIARHYVSIGEKPAVISRGYGGKLNNKIVHVISDGVNLYYKADMSGDEPYWLAVNTDGCAVITCSDRYLGAKFAVEQLGCTKIILDDGFQHRKFHRDLDIVLIDSQKQFGNNYLLPAGPLRENIEGLKRVDKLIIVSKDTVHTQAETYANELKQIFDGDICICKTEPDYIYNIMTGEHLAKGSDITAVSAIGQPEQFYKFLENDYNIEKKLTFDDHHQYTKEDIQDITGNIVTTEKDAVKLALLNHPDIYALKLKTSVPVSEILK